MFGLRTSRINENRNNNRIAFNLFQGDTDEFNENMEYEEALTKRGKVKNKSKIEYFKNYINDFKEKKFKTARQIEIFRKKNEKNKKNLNEKKEVMNFIQKEQENKKNKFNIIKEIIEEGREAQIENMNNINNKKNEMLNNKELKAKKNKKEITNEIFRNNENILKKLKNHKNKTKVEESGKEKIRNKIMYFKNKNKNNNLSCGKISDFLDRNNEKFLQLIKTKKLKLNKKKLSKSFNKTNKDKLFVNIDEMHAPKINNKTSPNKNIHRKIKEFRIKFNMRISKKDDKKLVDISEKEIFNIKHKNKTKATSAYISKSCFNKKEKEKDIIDSDRRFFLKIKKGKK